MLVNPDSIQALFFYLAGGILFFWLIALSALLITMWRHYRNLTRGVTKKDLKSLLDEILRDKQQQQKELIDLRVNLQSLAKDCLFHIQKVGFLRFNPFSDTGGKQSFILGLFDSHDSGVVLSSMHSRGTTRLYAKKVVKGKGEDFELSNEELKAVKLAKKLK